MKEDCIERFGIAADKIHVIYPALNTKVFYPASMTKITPKVNVAPVTSGNFKKRGLDLFSEAIESRPEDIRNARSPNTTWNSQRPNRPQALRRPSLLTIRPSLLRFHLSNFFLKLCR